MFGYKSAGIADEMVSGLVPSRLRELSTPMAALVVAPVTPGRTAKNETYIAPTQFTVASTPFFRWSQ